MADRIPLAAINGLFLDHPGTGTGVYTREVLARLLRQDHAPLRYAVVGHPEHRAAFSQGRCGRYISLEAPLRARSDKAEKILWEQLTLPLAAARLGADLLYSPYFSLPLLPGRRTVVTVHDVIPLLLPEYAPSTGFKAYFHLVGAATRQADAIVTDSHHSARDITCVLGVPPERIHVVYLGVDPRYAHPVPDEALAALRARLGLPDRFILYLGGIDPRKNVSVLLRALRVLQNRGSAALPVAIVAPRRERFADPREEARLLGIATDRVIFLDWISDDDKPLLYTAATAFAFPSRYEGFGLTPLEAMAAGTPVLCANSSSLPEVVGDAALLLDPDDEQAWAEALARIGDDATLRAELSAKGRVQAAQFTWDRTVAQLQDIFLRVLA